MRKLSLDPRVREDDIQVDLKGTEALAKTWAKKLKAGSVLALVGELGAGKTTFTKFLAQALGFEGVTSSPTFTLVNRYGAKMPIYHIDCYRLNSAEACVGAGIQEFLPSSDGVTLLEWANKFPELLPAGTDVLEFAFVSETQRSVLHWKLPL